MARRRTTRSGTPTRAVRSWCRLRAAARPGECTWSLAEPSPGPFGINVFYGTVQPRSFGGEDREVAGQRLARPGGDQRAVPGGDGGGERVHQARVAAGVPAGGAHPARGRRGDRPLGAGEEIVDADGLAVAGQFGPGAEEPGAAVGGL